MSIESFNRRVDKLGDMITAALPVHHEVRFPLDDLRGEDRAAFLAEEMTTPDGVVDLGALTNEQLYRLKYWRLLLKAQESGDAAGERQARRCLATPPDELLASFLALDENSIPDFDQAPTYAGRKLYRTYFRSEKMSIGIHLKRGSLLPGDLEEMHMWLDTFSPGPIVA